MFRFFPTPLFFVCWIAVTSVSTPVFAEDDKFRVGFLFEGTFETAEMVSDLEGARKTQLIPAYEWDYGIRLFTKEEWAKRGLNWESFIEKARKTSDAVAAKLQPDLIRDHRGVIDYALITSDDPFLGSVLMSPVFREKFKDSLGDQLHVVIVDRHILYVFPASGGKLKEYGPAVVKQFLQADLPVSLEIFLVDEKGFRVIGGLER